jgi:excinuclease ABC subunit C
MSIVEENKGHQPGSTEPDSDSFDSVAFLKGLTGRPGVYRMLDESGKVIYVGKARNLKKRVSSYFTRADTSPKTRAMVAQIKGIEVTVTHTEKEALILENNQIKALKPRYNIWFRDDKSYPYIHLSTEHDFPGLSYHRGAKSKKGRYFGPYPTAGAVRNTLNLMKKLFKTRQCKDSFFANRTRPCLEYQIKRCSAPCTEFISQEDYQKDIEHSIMFLQGKNEQVIDSLLTPMRKASDALEYERAAHFRDQISNLRKLQESQYITAEKGNIDVIACWHKEGVACVLVFFIRNGLNQGSKTYFPKHPANTTPESILEAFLAQFYLKDSAVSGMPREILLSHEPENSKLLQEVISSHVKRQIKVKSHCRGDRAKWVRMAMENAELSLTQHLANKESRQHRTDKLNHFLNLEIPIQRMECFDISHTGGEATVASCVVFDAEGPLTTDYRKFNITNITPGDDYAAMEQAITRRYTRVKKEDGKIPDIIFIDGGKGQVGKAQKVLEELQLNEPILIGVAKGPSRKAGLETLIIERDNKQQHLPHDSPVLHLIQHIRDESHRFAITGHRQRRKKKRNQSTLENIEGIGQKRRQNLLRHFGGIQGITSAGVEDLAKVNGINKNLAQKIYDIFHENI